MFRDDFQAARACRALLSTVRLDELWTPGGPTPEATSLHDRNGGPLSSGQRVGLLAAFAFWNGSESLRLADVLAYGGDGLNTVIFSLAVAVQNGAAAVDVWLVEYETRPKLRSV
jgi:hypothetical protein